jgi:RNA polymerase sigma factor (sigma-70 family)
VEQGDRQPRALRGARQVHDIPVSHRAQLRDRLFPASRAAAGKGAQDVDALADELSGPSHESPDAALSEAQLRADFKRALDELPAEQRDVFLLYEETGLGLEDIGRITGVAMETAKSRLRYALGKLRGALRQHQSPTLQSSVS